MTNTSELAGDRLFLRPFAEQDVAARARYQSLPEVARYLYRPPLTPDAARASALANGDRRFTATGDSLLFAVHRRADSSLVGEVVATVENATAHQVEVGWVFDPAFAGQGYATDAARLLLAHLFGAHDAHRVFARLDVENGASERLCERLGMRREAHLIENDRDGDRWGSEYVYAMLAREYAARVDRFSAGASEPARAEQ